MRHNKKFNHLGRTAGHRKALLANMASSLIKHKRITTTVAKAKALQVYIEPLITKSKAANDAVITPVVKIVAVTKKDGTVEKVERTIKVNSSTPARRLVFSYLKDKDAVKELFGTVASKVADRPGGYTRVLKTGFRQGDAAEMAIIELVDFNEAALDASKKKETKKSTRRSRRKSSSDTSAAPVTAELQEKVVAVEEVLTVDREETPKVANEVPAFVEETPTIETTVAEQSVIEDAAPEQQEEDDSEQSKN
ncbi:MAG: 50S ribosomal protein L17 [Prevotellaceae bacterium]|jgi:large subunit ribosomal protein L17|nr:50S ribosomal protein L17 [Prevotellaceae bacterium]